MPETDWESRYQRADTPWDKGEASPGLVDFLSVHRDLPRGSVLVPGCGLGHDARCWARAGFSAVGVDLAPTAITRASEVPENHGLPVEFRAGDFLTDAHFGAFDWIFEHTLYCAIDPARRDEYAQAVLRWLKPGGQFLAVHYLIPDEDGPPFGTTRAEVVERFAAHLQLLKEWVPRSYPNRTGLELMLWWQREES